MLTAVRDGVRYSFFYGMILSFLQGFELRKWIKNGRPVPPPHVVKKKIVVEYADRFGLETLVETGTYLGAMVYGTRNAFKHIYSIELDSALHEKAKSSLAQFPHIHFLQGNSSEVLQTLLAKQSTPCLFWLDAHYSGGVTAGGDAAPPILDELRAVLDHSVKGSVVLIDDARGFDPKMIEAMKKMFDDSGEKYSMESDHDIIRIQPVT